MNKPPKLLAALVAALDERHQVKNDSTRLQMVLSNVRPQVSNRPGKGFQLAYTVEISMPDFNGEPIEVVVPVLIWLERWQNDLVASPEAAEKAIDMTFVRLDDRRYDLHFSLELTEAVRYVPRPDGGHDVVYVEEPPPFALESGPPLHAVYLDGELIVHCDAHPGAGL